MIVVGTSGIVQPAASLPYCTKEAGGFLLEINLEPTPISDIADETLFGKAGEILTQLENSASPKSSKS